MNDDNHIAKLLPSSLDFSTYGLNVSTKISTKVCMVKAVVFPVVMYGCEIWTIKKAEHQRIDAFNCVAGEDS